MKRTNLSITIAAALAWLAAGALAAAAPADCPQAREPYSSRSPLLDVLLDPAARAVLARVAPAVLTVPFGRGGEWSTQPPTFAAIITPALVLRMIPDGDGKLPAVDAALARVALTPHAVRARCARYDSQPPILPSQITRPAALVFDKINGFRDEPSVASAALALHRIAQRRGFTLVTTNNGAVFTARQLARFDVVIWNNVSGDALTLAQRKAFKDWIERGGGFAGMHGAGGDPVYFWDWYADKLLGARFTGHPMSPQFQEARVLVEDPADAITAGLGPEWRMTEEWYSFLASPRAAGAHVLVRLDESTYAPIGIGGANLRMNDHPIAWTRCLGAGRSFYTAIGHRPESYTEPHSLQLLEQGIVWAAGLGATRCQSDHLVPGADE
jgi:type 1 glutamine amidotransferase